MVEISILEKTQEETQNLNSFIYFVLQTCPSDGKLLHFGMVENGRLEQVKGVTYSLKDFLGPLTWIQSNQLVEDVKFLSDENYYDNLEIRPGHDLYYFVMYLAPGDYHGFHSSADWTIKYRRHFPGKWMTRSLGQI